MHFNRGQSSALWVVMKGPCVINLYDCVFMTTFLYNMSNEVILNFSYVLFIFLFEFVSTLYQEFFWQFFCNSVFF